MITPWAYRSAITVVFRSSSTVEHCSGTTLHSWPVSALASFGTVGLLHRTQVVVQPVECFLDDFIPGGDVATVKEGMTLVLG